MVETGKDPQAVAEAVDSGELDLSKVPAHSDEEIRAVIDPVVRATVERINKNVAKRNAYLKEWGDREGPYLYIIVATGNIYEDIIQAKAGAKQGADIIAVIRTTGQSLLDYVPYGATTEGFGGTYATQENFRLMRAALDEVGEEQHRYIRLCNYCSGLCMPEIAAMGALERLDVMLNDALYGILFRDINMQRTIVDQFFSRVINGYAGVIINTGEDNYLTTDDAITSAHTVLASQFLNEAFAKTAGMREEQMGLGHAFEMDPAVEDTFLYELAQAQMAREIFPNAPLKYMPPTKFMTGNVFRGHIQDALFNMVTILTGQKLCLLGMMTEAIHTPFMSDRALSIENAQYIFRTMKDLGSELTYKENGIIRNRANEVLTKATDLLKEIEKLGLFTTIEKLLGQLGSLTGEGGRLQSRRQLAGIGIVGIQIVEGGQPSVDGRLQLRAGNQRQQLLSHLLDVGPALLGSQHHAQTVLGLILEQGTVEGRATALLVLGIGQGRECTGPSQRAAHAVDPVGLFAVQLGDELGIGGLAAAGAGAGELHQRLAELAALEGLAVEHTGLVLQGQGIVPIGLIIHSIIHRLHRQGLILGETGSGAAAAAGAIQRADLQAVLQALGSLGGNGGEGGGSRSGGFSGKGFGGSSRSGGGSRGGGFSGKGFGGGKR